MATSDEQRIEENEKALQELAEIVSAAHRLNNICYQISESRWLPDEWRDRLKNAYLNLDAALAANPQQINESGE